MKLSVSVSSEKPVTGRLTFSYVVGNAGWYPSYDIRVDDITNPVTIFYKANVFQNTGVTWKDVKLSFSNATPWVAGDVPDLIPGSSIIIFLYRRPDIQRFSKRYKQEKFDTALQEVVMVS